MRFGRLFFPFLMIIFLVSCAVQKQPSDPFPSGGSPPVPTLTRHTPALTETVPYTIVPLSTIMPPGKTPTSSPPLPSETSIPFTSVCSPLKDISLAELPGLIAGDTYQPPLPGRDDGHHGVDFAFYRHGSLTTMLGLPVLSTLTGQVAAVINNKTPYGNMLIIETPLENIPAAWLPSLALPTPAPTVIPDPRLTCPRPHTPIRWDNSHRSIYVLYAHLNKPPALHVGDRVTCGQVIGEVGTSGNSVNPHLHFETRMGPASATFDSLGHYDPRLTDQERSNYCTWRVSGWFQLFNPMLLLSEQP